MFSIFISAVIFVLIASIDLFACGLAYGTNKIFVPFRKVLVINVVGKVMVGAGLLIGYFLGDLMPDTVAVWLGFSIMFLLGVVKVIQWLVGRKKPRAEVKRLISWKETMVLAMVLSFDGFAMGLGATMTLLSLMFILFVTVISLFTDMLIFMGSQSLGKHLTKKTNLDLGWLSGIILIIVSVVKLCLELFVL